MLDTYFYVKGRTQTMVEIIGCPVSATLNMIGKKWTINLINDILFGKHRFSQLKDNNTPITSKVLSQRLKELETNGIITKDITSMDPVTIEYLTALGFQLRYILVELALFSTLNQRSMLLDDPEATNDEIIKSVGEMYQISEEDYRYYTNRGVSESKLLDTLQFGYGN